MLLAGGSSASGTGARAEDLSPASLPSSGRMARGTAEPWHMLGCLALAGGQSKVGRRGRQAGLLPLCRASVYMAGLLCSTYPVLHTSGCTTRLSPLSKLCLFQAHKGAAAAHVCVRCCPVRSWGCFLSNGRSLKFAGERPRKGNKEDRL